MRPETMVVFLEQFNRIVEITLLLSSPVIVVMFLAEMGLALVSRFVPQLQVFFLAMPIKSAIAMLVLMLYMGTLFEYGYAYVKELARVTPLLNGQWGHFGGVAQGVLR